VDTEFLAHGNPREFTNRELQHAVAETEDFAHEEESDSEEAQWWAERAQQLRDELSSRNNNNNNHNNNNHNNHNNHNNNNNNHNNQP
jgi:hypothetical protein